jgi:hypothetical protein
LAADVRRVGDADHHHCVGEPFGVERQGVARFFGAEDRRRDPAGREAGVGRGEHEVLDRGAEGKQRHTPFRASAAFVGITVEPVPREAPHHERGRAGDLRIRRVDQLVDARGVDAVAFEVDAPARAHAAP